MDKMPQEDMAPSNGNSTEKKFNSAQTVTCTVSSGSGDVTINGLSTTHKFGGGSGEIRSQSYSGVTKIKIKGTSTQNAFRIDY
jgi:hypothetical protein